MDFKKSLKNEEVNNFEEFFTTNEKKDYNIYDDWARHKGTMGVNASNLQKILNDVNKRLESLEKENRPSSFF